MSDDLDDPRDPDQLYERGSRMAWLSMLRTCLRELDGDHEEDDAVQRARKISEREEAIAVLRQLCEDFGDNAWDPTLHMADIIDKHLGKWMNYRRLIDMRIKTVSFAAVFDPRASMNLEHFIPERAVRMKSLNLDGHTLTLTYEFDAGDPRNGRIGQTIPIRETP